MYVSEDFERPYAFKFKALFSLTAANIVMINF